MKSGNKLENTELSIQQLENQISELKMELEEKNQLYRNEQKKRQFYQLVADFTFGWELWFDPSGKINYCSPSCHDLTGYTSNQIMTAPSLSELLIYDYDRERFELFVQQSLNQNLINPSLEFRIMTRTRQMRWCSFNVRGVYNREGRYLGIRGSVQDITKLKKALGHINDLSTGKELENRNRERLKSELEIKERELVTFLLQLSQKNELIARITQQLQSISGENIKNGRLRLANLLQLLENSREESVDWNMVEVQLEKLHPGFLNRLSMKHPKLTSKDKKLCACLKLGLTSEYSYDKMKIEKRALDRGIKLYEMAIWKFIGNSLVTRLQDKVFGSDEEIRKTLKPDSSIGTSYWVDLAGLICPFEVLDKLLISVENNEISTLEEVNAGLFALHKNYYNFEWSWAADVLEQFYRKKVTAFSATDVIAVIEKWKESVLGIDQLLYDDAKKEFSMAKMTGFGVDGQNGARELDFAQVRGEFEMNDSVKAIRVHMQTKEELGNELIRRMEQTQNAEVTIN